MEHSQAGSNFDRTRRRSTRRRSTIGSSSLLSDTMRSDDGPLTGAAKYIERIKRRWAFTAAEAFTGDDRLTQGEHFPTFDELNLLPDKVRSSVHARALGVIRSQLIPGIAVRLRLKARREMIEDLRERGIDIKAPTAATLNGNVAFNRWGNMRDVADLFQPTFFTKGETVVHEGEPAATGICVLGYGVVDASADVQLPPGFRPPRGTSFAGGDGKTPGSVVGDKNVMTQQPQRRTIRCQSAECVVWRLPGAAFLAALEGQDPAVQKHFEDLAVALRGCNMREAYSRLLLPPALVRFREFATFDNTMLTACGVRAVPKVFKAGTNIYESDGTANSIYLLVSGTVGIHKSEEAQRMSTSNIGLSILRRRSTVAAATPVVPLSGDASGAFGGVGDEEDAAAEHLTPLSVFGGLSWIQTVPRGQTAVAETIVDAFCIARDSVKAELAAQDPNAIPRLVDGDEDAIGLRYLQVATQIPFLGEAVEHAIAAAEAAHRKALGGEFAHLYGGGGKKKKKAGDKGPWDVFKDVAEALELKIFEEGEGICGTAAEVERLIIPLSGKAKVATTGADGPRSVSPASGVGGQSLVLPLNECIGFPLLVPHHWAHRVVVTRQLEALVLSYDTYKALLDKHGLAKRVTALSHALLFPDAAKPEVRKAAAAALSVLRGPALHPVTSLQSLATGHAPLQASVAASGVSDVALVTSGKGPSVCRKPTEEQLRKLKPIPVRTGMSCAVLSSDSKSRIIGGGRRAPPPSQYQRNVPNSTTPPPRLVPLVLGKQPRVTFGYGEALPRPAPIGSGVAGSGSNGKRR